MKPLRIIPKIDVKGPNVVKGIHFEGLRVLGEPHNFAKQYFEAGADEIYYQDVVASLYGQNTLEEIIKKTAKNIFIPLTVGGGIRSLDDIRHILRCGADKVSINTQAVKDPKFITEASNEFGSSTIVVALEVNRSKDGKYIIYTDNGREMTNLNAIDWCKEVEKLGAGEIVVTSIEREGTGKGFDIELCEEIKKNINIPLIIHGGAGSVEHVIAASKNKYKFDGISIASLLHYTLVKKNELKFTNDLGNKEFLNKNKNFLKFENCEIQMLKKSLDLNNIDVRL